MTHRFDVVFSGDFLLRDADDHEHATAGGKRWTEGFRGRRIGHNSHGWPVFAVTHEVAPMLAHWSQQHRNVYFRQCRTWHPDDETARRVSESMTAIYEWDGCHLRSSWRNQVTGQLYHEMALQLNDGWHVVTGHSWMSIQPELTDLIHGAPADTEPLRLKLTTDDLKTLTGLTGAAELNLTADDGTPITCTRLGTGQGPILTPATESPTGRHR